MPDTRAAPSDGDGAERARPARRPRAGGKGLKPPIRIAAALLALAVPVGCASTKVTSSRPYAGAALPRPDRILVHDFGSMPRDLPSDSALAAEPSEPMPQMAEDVALGRKLGAAVARQLTLDLRDMGLPAVQTPGQAPPRPGDIVIKGDFYGVNEGRAGRRILIGFGSGSTDLRTAVDVYRMTPAGLRHLAGGTTESGSGGTAGMVAPLAVFAATANPIGLIVVGGVKAYGQLSGRTTVEGDAKRTADAIAARFGVAARKRGWI
jgi:hypothetical protein